MQGHITLQAVNHAAKESMFKMSAYDQTYQVLLQSVRNCGGIISLLNFLTQIKQPANKPCGNFYISPSYSVSG